MGLVLYIRGLGAAEVDRQTGEERGGGVAWIGKLASSSTKSSVLSEATSECRRRCQQAERSAQVYKGQAALQTMRSAAGSDLI